ncbi:amidase [Salinarimonas rosea]|uniref:amidase n=1 Tax=Salinarimonas rosea TaxID=552063 RepID=UPI000424AF19|nr:amidase [Salinarimonas rosea]
MPNVPADPLNGMSLADFGAALRAGRTTSEAVTQAYLARINALDPRLGAYQHVAAASTLASARAIDALLAAGHDLGPLMGVPVAIKDLFAVSGMPTTAGSRLDVADLVGAEGSLVHRLKEAGCIVLGKVKTVEFALGITGVSAPHGTPVNPWDLDTPRVPGGSSSGSAVAVAAGLCAFALGSDTGGSVRVPAALCGVFGLKTSPGVLATDGAFPLAPHLDTPGWLTRSAADAALVHAAVLGIAPPRPVDLAGLRIATPADYFFDDLDPAVSAAVAGAMERLRAAGAHLQPVPFPEAAERERYFPVALPACLAASLGRARIEADAGLMDPVIARRALSGLEVRAADYLAAEARRAAHRREALARFAPFDVVLAPTTATVAPTIAALEDVDVGLAYAMQMTRNTQPGNYLDLCASSLPLPVAPGSLPVGLQLMAPPLAESRLLGASLAVETLLGSPALPRLG